MSYEYKVAIDRIRSRLVPQALPPLIQRAVDDGWEVLSIVPTGGVETDRDGPDYYVVMVTLRMESEFAGGGPS